MPSRRTTSPVQDNLTPQKKHHLLLINPSASPHVSLSHPAIHLDEPIRLIHPHQSSSSSRTHINLSSLPGGRYYDEYDEDELSDPPISITSNPPPPNQNLPSINHRPHFASPTTSTTPRPSPSLASFPPPASASKPRPISRPISHLPQHIIDLSPDPLPIRAPSPPPLTPSHRRPASQDWHQLARERPLLAFCIQLAGLLCASAALVAALVWALLPPIAPDDLQTLRIPTSFLALKKLNALLQVYKTENYYRVMGSFAVLYLFLQAFSLPGSMYLSILAGAMFGVPVGLPLVCLCVGTGALGCYTISARLAGALVLHRASLRSRLDVWRLQLATRTDPPALFAYLVVVRISPLPPHWAVNLLAPHVGIPPAIFWLSTCLGILPASLIHTQLGTTLDQMAGPDELVLLTPRNLAGLLLVAAAVLIPVAIRWYVQQRPSDAPRLPLSTERGPRGPARLCNVSQGHAYQPVPISASSASLAELCRRPSSDTLLDDSPRRGATSAQGPIIKRLDGRLSLDEGERKKASGHKTMGLPERAKEEPGGGRAKVPVPKEEGVLGGRKRQKSRDRSRAGGGQKSVQGQAPPVTTRLGGPSSGKQRTVGPATGPAAIREESGGTGNGGTRMVRGGSRKM